jgi:hypothetical protein
MCHIYMHEKGEKLARAFFLLRACWTSWLSSRRAREWLSTGKGKEESKEKTIGRVERARGCSWGAHLVLWQRSCPARAHGHIRYTRGKWSEWRAERAATGEQPGGPFYRPRRGLWHQLAFGVLSHATMVLRGRLTVVSGAARSKGRWIFDMHGRCLTLHGGRHACKYACVHTTKALLVLHACMCYVCVYVWVHG